MPLEIHAPHEPVSSWRDIAVHLGIVTVGILIALGLETVAETYRHHELAEEARRSILSEIRDNRKELAFYIQTLPNSKQSIDDAISTVAALEKYPNGHYSVNVRLHSSDLSESSWETAQSVGALAFMPYEEVSRYGRIYDFQRFLVAQQRQALQQVGTALSSFAHGQPSTSDLQGERQRLLEIDGQLTLLAQFAPQLQSRYDQTLKEKRD